MKLLVVGFGQCGSNIADGFARIDRRAHVERGIRIISGAFAVNTDVADLNGLRYIRPDSRHRVLIGRRMSNGHGVGKINELAAEIARDDADKVIDAIESNKRSLESDAILLCAGAAGGTGSGSISIMTKVLKERYLDKPIYDLIVLPFEHEESNEERATYNTAACLKSSEAVADAVFLVDNQRFARKNSALRKNLAAINSLIVEPFYNLLCAGEEKKVKYIGARMLDAGDIIQSIAGWTAIGFGRSPLPTLRFPSWRSRHFKHNNSETHRATEAMDVAIGDLSLGCSPADAAMALYLVSAPPNDMKLSIFKELGEYLKGLAPEAIIRNGDYPRGDRALSVVVMLSGLRGVEKVLHYYDAAARTAARMRERLQQIETKLRGPSEATGQPVGMGQRLAPGRL